MSRVAGLRRKDRIRQRSRSDLPLFHGVPLGIKDLNVVRWTTTRYGSRPLTAPAEAGREPLQDGEEDGGEEDAEERDTNHAGKDRDPE